MVSKKARRMERKREEVRERERERETETETETQREREREREGGRGREKERERQEREGKVRSGDMRCARTIVTRENLSITARPCFCLLSTMHWVASRSLSASRSRLRAVSKGSGY